jgi:hypothetical protein
MNDAQLHFIIRKPEKNENTSSSKGIVALEYCSIHFGCGHARHGHFT